MRLKTDINLKEATYQVVMDSLALTPFYHAFLITADVLAIYMQEFWATISDHKSSIRFTINKKKGSLDLATKRSKKDFHISHASGSGDGVDTQSKVPDEQQQKTYGTDEGTEEKEYDDEFNVEEDEKEDDEVTKELYKYVNVNLGNKDADMTYADQGTTEQQNASHLFGFDQEEKDAHVTLTPVLDTQKTGAIPKITSSFATPTPPPLFFNPLQQEATPTPTPTTFEATTSYTSLLDFTSVFKFNERVTNLEKDLSEIKQVDQYAQALSSMPVIVDRYMDNKIREVINKAIQALNFDCKEEAQAKKREYIVLVDSTMMTIIKEEVNAQLPQILPQEISDVATLVIKKNVTQSLETVVLTRSSSQPQSSYEAAATLFEFELTKILIDKIRKSKSFDVADYKRELYDSLVKYYNTHKDIFESYGEVFSLKRSRDDKDKDQDPSAGSDRGTKRIKSSKDAESSKDLRSKEKKSSSTYKDASQPQHKSSGKFAHAEEPSHTVEDSDKQQDQEFVTRDNDEQPTDKELKYDPHWGPKRQSFYGYASNLTSSKDVYSRRRIIALYTFKEGDFKRLCLQDIEDMLLLLVQESLTNLTINERRKRLMRTDEFHKFSDGKLNDVRSALYDIAAGIRMQYLPMRKWSNLDKKRARAMVYDINRQLYQRRLMRNLEKLVGGRVYGIELRILEMTI
uniref:Uncharacterized protein n=1 Tax=Tanacetum cinerariifolium TaxID=118510 RepID=A0A6L2JMX9_TANCI|nr:hypothetical protein [Tanacetum cinerariifolium]